MHAAYLTDSSGFQGHADKLFAPANEAEVSSILTEAQRQNIPVTACGSRTGLTGGSVAQGGWVLSLEKFRQLEIGRGSARAGAATTLLDLRDAAAPTRQFYAPDPTEITASVGGTIATNASGSRSFRFGSTRRHVNALRMAFIDGRIAEYRRGDKLDFPVSRVPLPNVTKCTAGYRLEPGMDWIDLICGSEGTLGIVLEADLQLLPIPDNLFAGVAFFSADEAALDAVDAWRGIPDLRMLEYVGLNALRLLRERFPEIPQDAAAALLIEAEDLDTWESRLPETAWIAGTVKDRERIRRFRHSLPELVIEFISKRGFLKMGTDYAVPLPRNREMLAYYTARLEADLRDQYVIYGHIGDAHVHVNMLPSTPAQRDTASALLKEFAAKAVELGGTVSAEHGLGKRKAGMLALQYAPAHIEAMLEVKRRLDPRWLLGRGNLFPVPQGI
ncbi:MAG: FAD-binding oxidoreductase [Acidobacteriota bacterium]